MRGNNTAHGLPRKLGNIGKLKWTFVKTRLDGLIPYTALIHTHGDILVLQWLWEYLLLEPDGTTILSFRGIFITGTTLLGAAVKTPRIRTKNLVRYVRNSSEFSLWTKLINSVVFCEAVAIYGVIMAILMSERIEEPKSAVDPSSDTYKQFLFSGHALFWTGMTVGISNLVCG